MWAWWRHVARLPAPPAASPNPPEASPASYRTARSDVESPQWWSPVKRVPARGRTVAPPSPPSSVGSGGAVVTDLMGRLSVQGDEEGGVSDGAASPSSLIVLSSSSDSDGDGAVSGRAPPATADGTRRPLFPVPAPAATAAPPIVKPAPAPPPPRRRRPPQLPPPENDPYALPVYSDCGDEVCVVDDDDESSEGGKNDDSDFVLSDDGDTAATASDWTPGGGRGGAPPGPSRPPPLTGPLTPAPRAAAAAFRRRRDAAAAALFARYNEAVFGGKLPADTQVTWSPRLRTTAGVTHFLKRRSGGGGGDPPTLPPTRLARVELSTKVIDSDARLETTLLHELCHVAAWVVDGAARPPHGPAFQKWAAASAAALPGAPRVTTCHSYAVHAPFEWRCVGGGISGDGGGGGDTTRGCGRVYRRHSKSIDVARHACSACRGRLAFVGRVDADGTVQGGGGGGGTSQPSRPPNPFAQFVAARFATVKASMPPGTPHKDVMKALGAAWREEKARGGGGGATAA